MFYVFLHRGRAPRVRHPSAQSAITEAKRLAALKGRPAYAVQLIEAVSEIEPLPLTRYGRPPDGRADNGLV